ncbi:UPF0160 protein myg1, mitochondrial [Saguinus oedipus]|uniref:UPF0160 protein myg1, mitochondrial n=1 Tax=Saguinus oedipus TaxID=9490 RepID=A0ABQ9UY93_SAGOE|nr:UPF0160 protein myg1, mitochondrial [Saguinus oedipus]
MPAHAAELVAKGTVARRKWSCIGASFSGSALLPPCGEDLMGHRFLRGLYTLLLLRPPPLYSRHMFGPESVPPSKRPCSKLMAPPRIGTHNGTFHCDEALACALLRLLPEYRVWSAKMTLRLRACIPAGWTAFRYQGPSGSVQQPKHPSYPPCIPEDAEIVRTRDPEKLASCDIVVDVGGEYDPERHRYDHHQSSFPLSPLPVSTGTAQRKGTSDLSTKPGSWQKRSFTETMSSLSPGKPWQTKLSSAGLIYLHFGHKLLAQLLGTSEEDSMVGTLYDKVGT